MDLRFFGLWAVVQSLSAVVKDASGQGCQHLNILNGYSFSDQNHLLYYACDQGFMPVEGSWWATISCQNGNWSSKPQCIADTSCFDPHIVNGIYDKFTFQENNFKLRVKCKSGYEDKNKLAIAHCSSGNWLTLPVCEKDEESCGPPPQIPNAVIINQVYEDIFPQEAKVQYVCRTGFELETRSKNTTICSYQQWDPLPSCRKKQINQDGVPQVTSIPTGSDDNDQHMSTAGNKPTVHDGAKDASAPTGSDDSHQQMFTHVDKCGSPPTVNNADFEVDPGQMFVTYQCNYWYKLNGNSIVRCLNNQWTPPPTCKVDFCELDTCKYRDLVNTGNIYIKAGTAMKLSCSGTIHGRLHRLCAMKTRNCICLHVVGRQPITCASVVTHEYITKKPRLKISNNKKINLDGHLIYVTKTCLNDQHCLH
ncbi:hypothetical protein NL108_016944 [Boleophthalmus pectinirostris]|nr:hypothetical protein NL108_016944 [Boleophthalmus pectinirostris]